MTHLFYFNNYLQSGARGKEVEVEVMMAHWMIRKKRKKKKRRGRWVELSGWKGTSRRMIRIEVILREHSTDPEMVCLVSSLNIHPPFTLRLYVPHQ